MAKKVKKTKKTTNKVKTRKVASKKKVKKTSAKKAAPKKKLPRRKKTNLTKSEIAHFTQLLLKKRAEIIGDVTLMENEALKKSRLDAAGDLSSMPIHMADIGTDNFEQEFALNLMDSERRMLVKINEALARIENGTYGMCQGTNEPIPKARLEAKPWAKYGIEYATMLEKGLVFEGDKVFDDDDSFDGQPDESEDEQDLDYESDIDIDDESL